jgi:hypothetical protein
LAILALFPATQPSFFVEMTVDRTGHVLEATVNMVNEGLDYLQIFQLGCSTREAPGLSSIPRGVRQPRITLQNFETVARRGNSVWPLAKHCRVTPWRGLCSSLSSLPSKEASVAQAVICEPKRRTAYEPLYDIDTQTGASVEIFYADRALAKSFGAPAGWFWWSCQRDFLPGQATGPFANSYLAYRDTLRNLKSVANFGKRPDYAPR